MIRAIRERFSSWRTSAVGAATIVYAIADLIVMFHNDEWDANRMGIAVMALLSGFGFISARDNAASVQQHAVQAAQIAQTNATAQVAAVTAETLAATVEQKLDKVP